MLTNELPRTGSRTQEIHFTFEDLAHTRILTTLGPVPETLFALDLLQHNISDAFIGWRKEARTRLGKRLGDLLTLARDLSPVANLVTLTRSSSDHVKIELNTLGIKKSRSHQLRDSIHEFYESAIRYFWPQVHGYLETERESAGRILFTAGFDRLLGTLHRQIQWTSPVLTLPHTSPGTPSRVTLNGSGIIIVPSLFLFGQPRLFLNRANTAKPPILVYPVPPSPAAASVLWAAAPTEQSLAALVGNTRAAVLRSLTDSRTTTEIAKRVGISAGSASQHATVLRNAGLITTHRTRTAAIHTMTPLGLSLFKGKWGSFSLS